jgi:predicted acetyltransferase
VIYRSDVGRFLSSLEVLNQGSRFLAFAAVSLLWRREAREAWVVGACRPPLTQAVPPIHIS